MAPALQPLRSFLASVVVMTTAVKQDRLDTYLAASILPLLRRTRDPQHVRPELCGYASQLLEGGATNTSVNQYATQTGMATNTKTVDSQETQLNITQLPRSARDFRKVREEEEEEEEEKEEKKGIEDNLPRTAAVVDTDDNFGTKGPGGTYLQGITRFVRFILFLTVYAWTTVTSLSKKEKPMCDTGFECPSDVFMSEEAENLQRIASMAFMVSASKEFSRVESASLEAPGSLLKRVETAAETKKKATPPSARNHCGGSNAGNTAVVLQRVPHNHNRTPWSADPAHVDIEGPSNSHWKGRSSRIEDVTWEPGAYDSKNMSRLRHENYAENTDAPGAKGVLQAFSGDGAPLVHQSKLLRRAGLEELAQDAVGGIDDGGGEGGEEHLAEREGGVRIIVMTTTTARW